MDNNKALLIINNIFKNVFNKNNTYNLDEIKDIFAYDIDLPRKVKDYITKETTYTDFKRGELFIKEDNIKNSNKCMMRKKENINFLEDILSIWNKINFITTERINDSINVIKSDTINGCNNVYMCTSCSKSNNIIYCDCVNNCSDVLASVGIDNCNFCIRSFDSSNSSNSFSITWSNKIVNSMFILDCYNLYECMFCAHIGNKRYCIANMQFEKEEYYKIKEEVINYILNKKDN